MASFAAVAAGALGASSGCAVSETDVRRWETTENGPEKLYAIVTHDKYSWQLREEAALSLVHMKPRSGKRVGLEFLALGVDTSTGKVQGALSVLSEQARRKIVEGITPKLLEEMKRPAPKAGSPEAAQGDESIPYKDAAFALVSHEPPLAGDEKTKADLIGGLAGWVQTDFEQRIENTSQQYGVEQIMRFIGAASVKTIPSIINESSTKVDRACALIADIGDDETKKRASEALVVLAKSTDSSAWIEKQRPMVMDSNAKQKINATPQQVTEQLKNYQESELEKVFADMKRVGGRPAVEYCLGYAHDKSKSEKMRVDALAALENRVDKNVANDVNAIFDIVKDDGNPDKVRGLALARLGELPKNDILPKLYSLFDAKKWQVRMDAAGLVLKTMSPKEVPDFLKHLPPTEKTKMGLSEPIAYAARIMAMDPAGGPKPHDVLQPFLTAKELGPKLTAIGQYYGGKKADAATLAPLEMDMQPVPKCDKADDCGWECAVPKAGSQDKENKTITNVGEFVKWCVVPSLQ